VVCQGREGFDIGAVGVLDLTEHRTEQRVERLHHLPVGAVRGRQVNALPTRLDRLTLGAEDRDISAAEPVDRLLRVANDEELAVGAGIGVLNRPPAVAVERLQQRALALVGILELVHKQRPNLALPVGAGLGVLLQQPERGRLQVVEVERPKLHLAAVIGSARLLEDRHQRRQHRPCQMPVEVQIDALAHQVSQHRIVPCLQARNRILGPRRRPVGLPPLLFQGAAQWGKMARDLGPIVHGTGRSDRVDVGQSHDKIGRQGIASHGGACERPVTAQCDQVRDIGLYGRIVKESAKGRNQMGQPGCPGVTGNGRPGIGDIQAFGEHRGQHTLQSSIAEEIEQRGHLGVLRGPPQHRFDNLCPQQGHLPLIKHLETGIDAHGGGVVAQDLGAQAVDGADPRRVELLVGAAPAAAFLIGKVGSLQEPADLLANARAHLAGGLPGKGNGNNRSQGYPIRQQREIAGHERARLARARARRHSNVASPPRHGGPLLVTRGKLLDDRVEVFYHEGPR